MLQYVRANVLLLCLAFLSHVVIITNIMIFWECNIYSEDILILFAIRHLYGIFPGSSPIGFIPSLGSLVC